MTHIARHYDQRGNLQWAKGSARDLYYDDALLDARRVHYRIPGEGRRYMQLLPARWARIWVTGSHASDTPDATKDSEFVLLALSTEREGRFFLAREISGDKILEAEIRSGSAAWCNTENA